MEKMQYKTFVWPKNPEQYKVQYIREAVYEKTDDGDTVFTGMGPMKRTFSGSGVFYGSTAYEDFKALAAVFADQRPGGLDHPIWGLHQAYFTELELTQEPKVNYVAYKFQFREADAEGNILE